MVWAYVHVDMKISEYPLGAHPAISYVYING